MNYLNINETELTDRLEEFDRIERDIYKFLENAPTGTLNTCTINNNSRFLIKEEPDCKRHYLSKKETALIKGLSQKEYDIKLLKTIKYQKSVIKKFIKNYNVHALSDVYEGMANNKKEYIRPYELPIKEYSKKWLETKMGEKEELSKHINWKYNIEDTDIHSSIITENGEIVRSKSEKILADKLNSMGIPYVYEMPVMIEGKWIRPDFIVLSIKDKKEYYWEHWGIMDNHEYVEKMILKKELYQQSNIYPGERILETFETSTHMINLKCVDEIIHKYLI